MQLLLMNFSFGVKAKIKLLTSGRKCTGDNQCWEFHIYLVPRPRPSSLQIFYLVLVPPYFSSSSLVPPYFYLVVLPSSRLSSYFMGRGRDEDEGRGRETRRVPNTGDNSRREHRKMTIWLVCVGIWKLKELTSNLFI
jgi:hypothetical protein